MIYASEFLLVFDLLRCEGLFATLGFSPLGCRMGDRSLPLGPCSPVTDPSIVLVANLGFLRDLSPWLGSLPLGLGALAGKEEIFGKSLPSLPFGTRVPSCPLAGEPEAGFFCSRTIWFLIRAIMTTTSFCANSSIIHFIINIFSSRRIRWSDWLCCRWCRLWWRRCFIWRRCNSRNWIFWSDFI